VETLCCHAAESSQGAAFVFAEEAVGIVLNHGDVVLFGDITNPFHFTSNSSVVNRDDGAGPGSDEFFYARFVEVQGVLPNVAKNRLYAADRECVCGRYKGKGWDDHLGSRLNLEQHRGQFERVGTGCGQQGGVYTGDAPEKILASMREFLISRNLAARERFLDVFDFVFEGRRTVEWNFQGLIGVACGNDRFDRQPCSDQEGTAQGEVHSAADQGAFKLQ